jgi:hypothetical protein
MNSRQLLATSMLVAAAWAMPGGAARADTVLYDGISLFQGQQAFTDSFSVSTAGTLTFTLSNIPWLDQVSGLTGFLSTSSGVIGSTISADTETLSIGPGSYSAHWFGDAQGTYNMGVVGMMLEFQPAGGITPVSIPGTLWLMLSGLGLLFGWQGRREPLAAFG